LRPKLYHNPAPSGIFKINNLKVRDSILKTCKIIAKMRFGQNTSAKSRVGGLILIFNLVRVFFGQKSNFPPFQHKIKDFERKNRGIFNKFFSENRRNSLFFALIILYSVNPPVPP
jgi:hypothetical protein